MMAMGRMIPESLLFHTVFWLCGSLSSKKGEYPFFIRGGKFTPLKLRKFPPTFGGEVIRGDRPRFLAGVIRGDRPRFLAGIMKQGIYRSLFLVSLR